MMQIKQEVLKVGDKLVKRPYQSHLSAIEVSIIGETRQSWLVGSVNNPTKVDKATLVQRGNDFLSSFYTLPQWAEKTRKEKALNSLKMALSNDPLTRFSAEQLEAAVMALGLEE